METKPSTQEQDEVRLKRIAFARLRKRRNATFVLPHYNEKTKQLVTEKEEPQQSGTERETEEENGTGTSGTETDGSESENPTPANSPSPSPEIVFSPSFPSLPPKLKRSTQTSPQEMKKETKDDNNKEKEEEKENERKKETPVLTRANQQRRFDTDKLVVFIEFMKKVMNSNVGVHDVVAIFIGIFVAISEVPLWIAVPIVAGVRVLAAKNGTVKVHDIFNDCMVLVFFSTAIPVQIAVVVVVLNQLSISVENKRETKAKLKEAVNKYVVRA